MANQITIKKNFADEAMTRMLAHYKTRPLHVHFAAWMIIGIAFGITMLPNFSIPALLGFGISGVVVGAILCFVTYPFSGHFSYTVSGALIGAAIMPMLSLLSFFNLIGPVTSEGTSICLLIGALIGGTSSIWQAPLGILRMARTAFAPSRIHA